MMQTVEQFLGLKNSNYSVIKFVYIPESVEISYSYSCNKNAYLPIQDAYRSVFSVPETMSEFSFTVELFKTNVMAPEKTMSCFYKDGIFKITETKNNPAIGSNDARQLQKNLGISHKDEYVEYPAHKIVPNKSELSHIVQSISNETQKKRYSVIKIEGLSKEISVKNAFYYEGCHFIPAMSFNEDNFETFFYDDNKENIIVSFFGNHTNHAEKVLSFNPKTIKQELEAINQSIRQELDKKRKKDTKAKKKSA